MDDEQSRPDDVEDASEAAAAESQDQDPGGPAEDLEEDPAYSPDDDGLKQIKGG